MSFFGGSTGGGGSPDGNGGLGTASPGSSTDNAIIRWDGVAGNAIQDSLVIVSDLGAITGAKSLNLSDLTASRALVSDGSKNVVSSSVTDTELGYVSGVTSAIQTQIGTKVTGPASATDNAVVRFDATTGKLVQNSGILVSDTDDITGVSNFKSHAMRVGASTLNVFAEYENGLIKIGEETDVICSTGSNYGAGFYSFIQRSVPGPAGSFLQFRNASGSTLVTAEMFELDTFTNPVTMTWDLSAQTVKLNAITASRVLTTNASQEIAASSVTTTELGYVSGVTSAIQTQLDAKVATSGRLKLSRVAVADANYTVLTSDYYVGLTSITVSRTFMLPAAASAGTGSIIVIKDESGSVSGTVKLIVDGNASETIDGDPTFEMTSAYESLTLMCNGSNWFII